MTDYEILIKTISDLHRKNFLISLDDGRKIPFHFHPACFFHLLGLHYISDMPHIAYAKNKSSLIKQLQKDERLFAQIKSSTHYEKVRSRIETFYKVSEMLLTDKCEIILEFDKSLAPEAKINSCFLLYKTEDRNTYHILGIAADDSGAYYPETYIVEASRYYVSGQTPLNCRITHKEFVYKHISH